MKKITEKEYNTIKKAIKTPVVIMPSLRMVANNLGYSSGTVSMVASTNNFEEYSTRRQKRPIETDFSYYEYVRNNNKKVFDDFNSEWYFEGK